MTTGAVGLELSEILYTPATSESPKLSNVAFTLLELKRMPATSLSMMVAASGMLLTGTPLNLRDVRQLEMQSSKSSALETVAVTVSVWSSPWSMESSRALTVTVWGILYTSQWNMTDAGEKLSFEFVDENETVTSLSGWLLRATVKVDVAPDSATTKGSAAGVTVTDPRMCEDGMGVGTCDGMEERVGGEEEGAINIEGE
mmetsp:Transcript_54694/g.124563  ORF Transcript_54694/g.124563 Transcript_54694/m.124563 type:complete len:200 (+) Transcript_54694:2746-3345(+)